MKQGRWIRRRLVRRGKFRLIRLLLMFRPEAKEKTVIQESRDYGGKRERARQIFLSVFNDEPINFLALCEILKREKHTLSKPTIVRVLEDMEKRGEVIMTRGGSNNWMRYYRRGKRAPKAAQKEKRVAKHPKAATPAQATPAPAPVPQEAQQANPAIVEATEKPFDPDA